jgi:hypothetical protein
VAKIDVFIEHTEYINYDEGRCRDLGVDRGGDDFESGRSITDPVGGIPG